MAETATLSAPEGQFTDSGGIPPAAGAPPPPLPPGLPGAADFGAVAAQTDRLRDAQARQRGVMQQKTDALAPMMAQMDAALEERIRRGETTPPPRAATITAPPSRGLSAFLATREGETPEQAVSQLITGLSVFAGGIGALGRGNARGALAALGGALKGWQEGDKDHADRAFADWRAKTDAAIAQHTQERQEYEDILTASNVTLEQRKLLLTLAAAKWENPMALAAFESGVEEKALAFASQQQTHADAVDDRRLRLVQMHEDKLADIARRERETESRSAADTERRVETARHNREVEALGRERAADAKAARDDKAPTVGASFVAALSALEQAEAAHAQNPTPETQRAKDLAALRVDRLKPMAFQFGGGIAGPSGGPPIVAPTRPPASSEATMLVVGSELTKKSADTITALLADADTGSVIGRYLGKVNQYRIDLDRARDKLPREVVQLESNLANLTNYFYKLMSGAAVVGSEEKRLVRQVPKLSSPRTVFGYELEATRENITFLERRVKELALRGDPAALKVASETGLLGPASSGPGGPWKAD